ncbi:amidase family protein [Thiohalorhabdus sp. Cl-TMA]|uniref:Amidase family protein n=1 Tax=Thiohalorhabdus methylotrophus TaxID=3242694 RepID=A0ABV4U0U0_9GAMM
MKRSEYVGLDALGMAELVQSGEVTASELMACALSLAGEQGARLNAVASVAENPGSHVAGGVFEGVPFLVKELLAYPGLRTSMGSRLFADYVATEHTPYTRRLEESGLAVFGNTTSSELGLLGSTETLLHGPTINPWRDGYSAGGSSGGSAAAVAAGIVPFAHASDAGGSIRGPASACGVFGFKPSAGRCVAPGDAGPLGGMLAEHCISRTVRDSAALLSVTEATGAEARYPPIGFFRGPGKKRLKIGYYTRTLTGGEADAEVEEALNTVAALCWDLGHEVVPTPGPEIDGKAVSEGFFTVAGAAMDGLVATMQGALGREIGSDDLEPFTLRLIEWYRTLGRDAMARAIGRLQDAGERMNRFAEAFDVLLCPTLSAPAQPLGWLSPRLEREELVARTEDWVGYTPIHNAGGMPAMSVPLSMSGRGLPIGSHFAARPGDDALLLGLAYELEQAAPWAGRLPPE